MRETPKRRFQFRLRSLMIGVALLAVVGGGYLEWQAKIARQRAFALAIVHKVGGWSYDNPDDPSRVGIYLPDDTNVEDRHRIRAALPYADIWGCHEPVYGMDGVGVGARELFRFDDDRAR
jgi:hypothetical protein